MAKSTCTTTRTWIPAPCKMPRVATHHACCPSTVSWGHWGNKGFWGPDGHQPRSRFSERCCSKEMRLRIVENDPDILFWPPHACVDTRTCTYMCMHTTHAYTIFTHIRILSVSAPHHEQMCYLMCELRALGTPQAWCWHSMMASLQTE